jgi:LPXTG-motif cell wall-anchored protein
MVAAWLLAVVSLALVVHTAGAATHNKVTICHRTDSYTNPYVRETVDVSAVDGAGANDHSHHTGPIFSPGIPKRTKWGDIIPGVLNWTAEGQSIWSNGCALPGVPTTTASPTSEGSSTTEGPPITGGPPPTAGGSTTTIEVVPPTSVSTTTLAGTFRDSTSIAVLGATAGGGSSPVAVAAVPGGSLPRTGTNTGALVWFGAVFTTSGLALAVRSRCRVRRI